MFITSFLSLYHPLASMFIPSETMVHDGNITMMRCCAWVNEQLEYHDAQLTRNFVNPNAFLFNDLENKCVSGFSKPFGDGFNKLFDEATMEQVEDIGDMYFINSCFPVVEEEMAESVNEGLVAFINMNELYPEYELHHWFSNKSMTKLSLEWKGTQTSVGPRPPSPGFRGPSLLSSFGHFYDRKGYHVVRRRIQSLVEELSVK